MDTSLCIKPECWRTSRQRAADSLTRRPQAAPWKRFPLTHFVHKEIDYLFDGTLEGLFSVIYTCFATKTYPQSIQCANQYQATLLSSSQEIATNPELAERVRLGIVHAFGRDEYERIRTASLSDDIQAATVIFKYLAYAYDQGPGCWHNLTVPEVDAFETLWTSVYNERHRMLQFTRFAKMENGIYFAKINPKANVVPLVMGHFAGRFNVQPFLIYDEVHHIAGIWNQERISLVETSSITLPPLDEKDLEYQRLWKIFYDRICNAQRLNPALRRSFMPMRLWQNITEMDERLAMPKAGTPVLHAPLAGALPEPSSLVITP